MVEKPVFCKNCYYFRWAEGHTPTCEHPKKQTSYMTARTWYKDKQIHYNTANPAQENKNNDCIHFRLKDSQW